MGNAQHDLHLVAALLIESSVPVQGELAGGIRFVWLVATLEDREADAGGDDTVILVGVGGGDVRDRLERHGSGLVVESVHFRQWIAGREHGRRCDVLQQRAASLESPSVQLAVGCRHALRMGPADGVLEKKGLEQGRVEQCAALGVAERS
jgi:hypothetical protein